MPTRVRRACHRVRGAATDPVLILASSWRGQTRISSGAAIDPGLPPVERAKAPIPPPSRRDKHWVHAYLAAAPAGRGLCCVLQVPVRTHVRAAARSAVGTPGPAPATMHKGPGATGSSRPSLGHKRVPGAHVPIRLPPRRLSGFLHTPRRPEPPERRRIARPRALSAGISFASGS